MSLSITLCSLCESVKNILQSFSREIDEYVDVAEAVLVNAYLDNDAALVEERIFVVDESDCHGSWNNKIRLRRSLVKITDQSIHEFL